jgi:hypothetical protein
MCDPITIAAMVATVAGGAINSSQQAKAQQAQIDQNNKAAEMARAAREMERVRQQGIDRQNFDEVRATAQKIDPAKRAETVAAAAPTGEVAQAATRYADPTLPVGVDGEVIADTGKLAEESGRTNTVLDALAILSGQGAAGGGAQDALSRFGSVLSNNNSKGRRSLSVADFEAAVPTPTVRANSSPIGDILQLVGSAGSLYGGANMTSDPFKDVGMLFNRKSPRLMSNFMGG